MKTQNIVLSALLILSQQALAVDAPVTGVEAKKIIDSEFGVTESTVNDLVKKITHAETETDRTPLPPDYLRAAGKFTRLVSDAMIAFEGRFHDQVLLPLAPTIANYNSLMSMPMSKEQFEVVREQQIAVVKDKVNEVSPAYKAAIEQVYHALDLPWDPKLEFQPGSAEDCPEYTVRNSNNGSGGKVDKRTGAYRVRKSDWKSVKAFKFSSETALNHRMMSVSGCALDGAFDLAPGPEPLLKITHKARDGSFAMGDATAIDFQDALFVNGEGTDIGPRPETALAYQSLVFPMLADGCDSLLCVALRVADVDEVLKSIGEKIDRDIPFTLSNPFWKDTGYQYPYSDHVKDIVTLKGLGRGIVALRQIIRAMDYPKEFVPKQGQP